MSVAMVVPASSYLKGRSSNLWGHLLVKNLKNCRVRLADRGGWLGTLLTRYVFDCLTIALEQPDIINDLDVDFSDPAAQAAFINDVRNIRKIREVASKLNVSTLIYK